MNGTEWMHREQSGEMETALRMAAIEYKVPSNLHDGLVNHLVRGMPTGHFLSAVFANDLKEACNRADYESAKALYNIVSFLYNHAPTAAWGSPAAAEGWKHLGGWLGMRAGNKQQEPA